ncbi:hypothetical protein L2E82_30674 [Cichorium intybus]|uniref:Uncharacterized protein n=1 Tax=Cichorium intybus TaxID=13427 RepID=A0ACB9D117_CICIN|nr:hypothetical protein L2E82_30674 [Cichorium intybus]
MGRVKSCSEPFQNHTGRVEFHTGRVKSCSEPFQNHTGRVEFHTGRVDLTDPLNVQKCSLREKHFLFDRESSKWRFWVKLKLENRRETWGDADLIPYTRSCFLIRRDYGDITKSSEQKPGTRKLGVPRTKPILGICSSDRGRHVIKRDGHV